MSKEMNKTISHTGIYTLGNIMRQMVSFIMLPIYTRCLTPADYGVIELLSMIIDFFAIFLGLRIGEAIFRFYTQYEDKREKDEVISTALIMVGLLNMAGIMLIIIGAGPLSKIVFGSGEYVRYVVLFAFTLLFQSFIEIPMLFIRAQQKPWLFVGFSLMKLVLQLSLNIYFVVIMQLRVEGVIYSALISGGVMSAIMLGYTFSHIGMRFARAK
ncbi:MAG TPA: oligosaccharide flippase family protein, partial [Deltaproteobacteria bacterium]|nr:oligosaccharide flippase family protein [Deltaproteobacteria bacterium]